MPVVSQCFRPMQGMPLSLITLVHAFLSHSQSRENVETFGVRCYKSLLQEVLRTENCVDPRRMKLLLQ